MALCVGIDVSKEKFDACGIGEGEEKIFSVSCPIEYEGHRNDACILAGVLNRGTRFRASCGAQLFRDGRG